jgi:N-methylhydantoinase A
MRLSIDTGGTFTDAILELANGSLTLHKAPTTPADPIEGILEAIGRAAAGARMSTPELLDQCAMIIHGTTRATNAIITGTVARTAFITTAGHPDILRFRMGGRERPFDHARDFPDPYVQRSLTFELDERIDYAGTVVRPLEPATVEALAERLLELEVEAAGVCLLWSVLNPRHELLVGDVLARRLPDVQVTLSHRLNPVIREYHRASAACIDASLKPLMSSYLGDLGRRLQGAGFAGRLLVASAAGGLMEPAWLAEAPIHSINSGPSMAPLAGRHHAARETGADTTIVVDTGGTSFDVSVVRAGRIPRTRETWLGERYQGHLTGFPAIDVRTTGAGGGSIARVDSGGLLTVGPDSAGSVPGPVCYGRGGELVTVTDASMVLGYLEPRRLRSLGIEAQPELARRALAEQIGDPLGLDVDSAADAVIRVLTEGMVHAVGEVTVEQGIDPRAATLVSGGGAAGFNIVAIATRLGCNRLLIPLSSAALSATGGLISEVYVEEAAALFTITSRFEVENVNGTLAVLSERCRDRIGASASAAGEPTQELIAEARYPGQVWEIEVPLRVGTFESDDDVQALAEDFHALHESVFAVRDTGSPVEVIGWRARLRAGLGHDPGLALMPSSEPDEESSRQVYLRGEGRQTVPVVGSARISKVEGPAILELPGTTVVLDRGAVATRADSGTIVITPPRALPLGSSRAQARREQLHVG